MDPVAERMLQSVRGIHSVVEGTRAEDIAPAIRHLGLGARPTLAQQRNEAWLRRQLEELQDTAAEGGR